MTMNKMKYLALAFATAMASLLLACGGGDDDGGDPYTPPVTPTPNPTVKGKFLTKTLDMPAEASEDVVALNGLSAAISRTVGSASWLTVTPLSYASGAPQIKVAVTANLQTDMRQQDVTFYAANDTLQLTVRQSGAKAGGTDVTDPNDTPTDQPAYAPRR